MYNSERNTVNTILKHRFHYKYGIYKDKIYIFPEYIIAGAPPCELTKNEFEQLVKEFYGIASKILFVYGSYIHILSENKEELYQLELFQYHQHKDLIGYIKYNAILNFYKSNQAFFDEAGFSVFNICDYCDSLEIEEMSDSYILKLFSSFTSRSHLYNDIFMGDWNNAQNTIPKIESYINTKLRTNIMEFALGKLAETYDVGYSKNFHVETVYNKNGKVVHKLYCIPISKNHQFPDCSDDHEQFSLAVKNFFSKFEKEIEFLKELVLDIEGKPVYPYINTSGNLIIQVNTQEDS